MKNIHILPTDKPSRLIIQNVNKLILGKEEYSITENRQHIYITSDEKPKARDLSLYQNKIHKCYEDIIGDEFKKIILTTDQELIKDGVQVINDDFLEWFCKNSWCENVGIERSYSMSQSSYSGIEYEITMTCCGAFYGCDKCKVKPFKHECKVIPAEEILTNRSNAYEFIDFDKNAKTYLVNHYIAPFLLKNGFKGSGGDSYYNSKCTVNVLEDCHQIDFNHPEYGKVSTYTDSHSIMHLVGVLTWNDLIDKNYKK